MCFVPLIKVQYCRQNPVLLFNMLGILGGLGAAKYMEGKTSNEKKLSKEETKDNSGCILQLQRGKFLY